MTRPSRTQVLERKLGPGNEGWPPDAVRESARKLDEFLVRLGQTSFRAVIFDFDGTLYDGREPDPDLPGPVAEKLTELLSSGVLAGIATGRGRSLRDTFRRALSPEVWDQTVMGYDNGGETLLLGEPWPDGDSIASPTLGNLAEVLEAHPQVRHLARIDRRRFQITLEPLPEVPPELVHRLATELVNSREDLDFTVTRSTYSVDILPPGVSKLRVYERMRQMAGRDEPVLCIGDSGTWEGNDLQLLSTPFSLSVDASPLNAATCWNLASIGRRRVEATLDYLDAIRPGDGMFAVDVYSLLGGQPHRSDATQ